MIATPLPGPRPNLFIPGAPKSGTTAWVEYLSTHPDITFGAEKEPHYFNFDLPWMRRTTREHYRRCYEGAGGHAVRGDASVMYLFSEEAAAAAAAACPGAKVLILLREPAAFFRSYHNHMRYLGVETVDDPAEAWALSAARRRGERVPRGCPDRRAIDYETLVRFGPHVARWRAAFPAADVKVAWMDEWAGDPRRFYLELMGFLGLEDDGRDEFARVNEAPAARSPLLMRGLRAARDPVLALTAPARRLVRRARGGRRLGAYGAVRAALTKRGSAPPIGEELAERIRRHAEGDREAVGAGR